MKPLSPCQSDASASRRRVRTILLGVALVVGFAGATGAQEARGTITGTVRDSSKAVIPGATVTVTNIAMGTSVPLTTNEIGWFQAPYLIPGMYQVTIELQGFKKYVREVNVRVDDRIALDVPLEVGASVETIT